MSGAASAAAYSAEQSCYRNLTKFFIMKEAEFFYRSRSRSAYQSIGSYSYNYLSTWVAGNNHANIQ